MFTEDAYVHVVPRQAGKSATLEHLRRPGAELRRYRSQVRSVLRVVKRLDFRHAGDRRLAGELLGVYADLISRSHPGALPATSLESVRTTIAVDRLLLAAGGGRRG